MLHWIDVINGQRLATVFATAMVCFAFSPQTIRFLKNFKAGRANTFEDRLTLGFCSLALGSFFYSASSIIQTFVGRESLFSIIPLSAGGLLLFGYYQIYIAWCAARRGKLNGFVWKYAALVAVTFVIGTVLNYFFGDHLTFRGP